MSTTQEPKESDINVTKAQLQSLENKLGSKILAFKSYLIGEILSLKNQIKAYKINDNVQELSTEKLEDLVLLRERLKYLESENCDIFNKQKLIDKLLENNNKLVDHQSHHVPVQYTFFYKQSIFDPRPENCLSFSKKSPPKIV